MRFGERISHVGFTCIGAARKLLILVSLTLVAAAATTRRTKKPTKKPTPKKTK